MGKPIPVSCDTGDVSSRYEYMSYDIVSEYASRLNVNCPERFVFNNDTDFQRSIHECLKSSFTEGLMITQSQENPCNERIRILSNGYEEALRLRGTSPSIRTNMIHAWASDPTGDLLRTYEGYYPDEKEELHSVVRTLNESANELVLYYKNRHVRKSMEHGDLPHWSRKPIWDLHGIYLRERVPINKMSVLEYYRKRPASFVNKILKTREKEIKRDLMKVDQGEKTNDE
jgi:hypothetical protein